MPRFRKKPVVINAWRYVGTFDNNIFPNDQERDRFAEQLCKKFPFDFYLVPTTTTLRIRTLEGDHEAKPGDMIVRGVKGEFYPVKPDIFEATYEPA